jgi:aryl-alcohol dehydrogenase-like predicted oxidoreductase
VRRSRAPAVTTSSSPPSSRRWIVRAVEDSLRRLGTDWIDLYQTAALLGPRTMEQLQRQLPAGDVVLDDAVLDRIDEIVAPGTSVNPVDNSFANPALESAARRR